MRSRLFLICVMALAVGCAPGEQSGQPSQSQAPASAAAPETPQLGIRPNGDTAIGPDLGQVSDELKKIYDHIDANIDQHVGVLQRTIQQPSISNTGEGIPETAQMMKAYFDELGCQDTRVVDVGVTEYGSQGNPVVFARCDEGAEKTLVMYWMYDTMPITQPDLWKVPPFEGQLLEQGNFKKVLVARGATNSKGPQMTTWNALMSIRAVAGKLPVNLLMVAEGDEERMSIGFRKFVKDNPDLFKDADGMIYPFGSQGGGGGASIGGASEGCVYIELTTSGAKWGRGPVYSDIHGGRKRAVDSPAWRHMHMLESLVEDMGNRAAVEGFYDNIEPLSAAELELLERSAKGIDLQAAAKNLGVARFIADTPLEFLKMARYGVSFNLDGIWGGNMYAGGAGAILPNKITSKHNIRYVPNMDGPDLVDKIRKQLDRNGFADVDVKLIGDVPWCKMTYDNDVAKSLMRTYDIFGVTYGQPPSVASILGGYWPAYLFGRDPMQLPVVMGGLGHGGNAHAANEFWVVEGAGNVYGMAGAEKAVATWLYNYAGRN